MTTLEIPIPEFIRRFQSGEIPPDARLVVTYEDQVQDSVRAKLHRWQRETATQTTPTVSARELLRRWDEEDAQMSDEEKSAESRLWEEMETSLAQSRAPGEAR